MTFSGCDISLTVDYCSFSICRTQSSEELGRVGERSLGCRTVVRRHWLFFLMLNDERTVVRRHWLFFNAYAEKERTRREGRHNSPLASQYLHPLRCMQKRDSVSVPRHSEVRAGRLSGRFRLRAHRTVQTRPVSSRSVHHGIFPDVYFYTQSLQRRHKRRPMASRREQVSALFFVAWTQRRLTECFPWATEGPNPPKETLTFKKEFFVKQLRDHYPRALKTAFFRLKKFVQPLPSDPGELSLRCGWNI